MAIDFKLTNQNLINYARTDDAHEAFTMSVNNGQSRLALEVLLTVIDGLVDKVNELEAAIGKEEIRPPKDNPAPASPLTKPKNKPIRGEAESEEVAVEA